jgi:xanthine dehydrogenase YagS FAD-binding subunit
MFQRGWRKSVARHFLRRPELHRQSLVAPEATFRVIGPSGERTVPAAEFFSLPHVDAKRENVLGKNEILASILLPPQKPNSRSIYQKILDREA